MALIGEEKTAKEEGLDKKKFHAIFDNGTLEQLEDLRAYFKQSDKVELVRLAISTLQRIKDLEEPKK